VGKQHSNGGFAVGTMRTVVAIASLTTTMRRRLSMVKNGVCGDQHPTTRPMNPPAKVHVIPIQWKAGVKAG
jgi:hypothetical protein